MGRVKRLAGEDVSVAAVAVRLHLRTILWRAVCAWQLPPQSHPLSTHACDVGSDSEQCACKQLLAEQGRPSLCFLAC